MFRSDAGAVKDARDVRVLSPGQSSCTTTTAATTTATATTAAAAAAAATTAGHDRPLLITPLAAVLPLLTSGYQLALQHQV